MSLGGSAPAGNTTVTQSNAPFSGQQPYLFGSGGTAPGNTGYSTQNTSLMNLLGGSLANSGGSSPMQDIARAMSEGLPISNQSWAQAGLPPGGGSTGQQLQSDIFGNPSLSQANPTIGGNAIQGLLPAASNLFQNYTPQYYPGATYASPTPYQMMGIDMQAQLGLNGQPTQGAAQNTALGIMNPGFLGQNPGNSTYNNAANGGMGLNTGGFFAPLASGQLQNTAGQGTLQNAASGGMQNTAGTGTLSNIAGGMFSGLPGMSELANIAGGSNLSASNPYFKQMADNITAQVLPSIEGQFAAGNRMNGGLAANAAASGLGNAIGGLAYQNYQQGLQQQQSAAQELAGLSQGNVGQQMGAAGMLSGIGAQNIANELGAANSLGQFGQQNIGNILSGAQGLTGVEQQNFGNQFAGAAGQSANYSDALKNQIQAMALSPEFQSMAFNNAGAVQGAGSTQQALQQQYINDAVNRWNYYQQLPYNKLNQYGSAVSGNFGGTGTTTSPFFQNGAANALGLGLGAGMLNNVLGDPLSSILGSTAMTASPGIAAGAPFMGAATQGLDSFAGSGLAGGASDFLSSIGPFLMALLP